MRNIYKKAASLLLVTMILLSMVVPAQWQRQQHRQK